MSWIIYFLEFLICLVLLFVYSYLDKRTQNSYCFMDANESLIDRGIAATLVLGHHLMGAFGKGETVLFTPWGGIGVAIFLICSGYGLTESWKINGKKGWWRKRIISVFLPYALLSTVLYWPFHKFSLKEYLLDITWINPQNGWYLQYLLVWYILFYMIMLVVDDRNNIWCWGIVALLLFFIFRDNELKAEQSLSFICGILFSKYKNEIQAKVRVKNILILGLVGIGALILKQFELVRQLPHVAFNLVQLTIKLPCAICMIFGIHLLASKINLKVFAWIGNFSYELYILHLYLLAHIIRIHNYSNFPLKIRA